MSTSQNENDQPTVNPAVLLGRLRWKGIAKEKRSEQMAKVAAARAEKVPAECRKEIAIKASKAAAIARTKRAAEKRKVAKKTTRKRGRPKKNSGN